jgi:protein gp37
MLSGCLDSGHALIVELPDLPNIWWGISVNDRAHGLVRIKHLQQAPAAIRFFSIEPLLEELGEINLDGFHWVIHGGESGAGARPMHKEWVLSLRDQCEPSQVPFFFKQWGGVRKSKSGRELDGKTYDGQPDREHVTGSGISDATGSDRRIRAAGRANQDVKPAVPEDHDEPP